MSIIDKIFKKQKPVLWDMSRIDRLLLARHLDLFQDSNPSFNPHKAYGTALSIAEIYYPIDLIADTVSTLEFNILDDDGNVVERVPNNIKRLLNKPNAFCSFSQMIYDAVFISLSDGNLAGLRNVPAVMNDKPANVDNIFSIQLLRPTSYSINIKTDISPLFASDITELIQSISYSHFGRQYELSGENVILSGSSGFPDENLRYPSPLSAAKRNIENLLAVYQARYKIYTKNGAGGILTKKATSSNGDNLADAINDPVTRDMIVEDVLKRYGLTGEKLPWAVSAIPLEFVRTLATISELQPFDETREDALQIAGVMNVDKDLLPMKEGVTYANKDAAMLRLYTGPVKTQAEDIADFFTRLMCLDSIGLHLSPDFDGVDILQNERAKKAEGDAKIVDLMLKLRENDLTQESDMKEITERIINTYKQ